MNKMNWKDWGAAGGLPHGWVLQSSPCCGNSHGVGRNKLRVLWDVVLCWVGTRPHPHKRS
jgi:hypothetical protein